MLKWEIKSKLFSSHCSLKVFNYFAFAFNLSFLGTRHDIATLFLSVLADLASWTILFAISLKSLLVTRFNMKNYLCRWFFLGRFHVVFHIVYFSTREMFCNNVLLKFSRPWNGMFIYIFTIESPKITATGDSVFAFLLDTVSHCPCWGQNCHWLDNCLDHNRCLRGHLAKFQNGLMNKHFYWCLLF